MEAHVDAPMALPDEAAEDPLWEELWDVHGGLKAALLTEGDADRCSRYGQALARRKMSFYMALTDLARQSRSFVRVQSGLVTLLKYKISPGWCYLQIHRDHLVVLNNAGNGYSENFAASLKAQNPIFVLALIESKAPVPLGLFVVTEPAKTGRIDGWLLRRIEDAAALPPLPRLSAAGAHAAGISGAPTDDEVGAPGESTDAAAAPRAASSLYNIPSRRFSHGGDVFDSVLEAIHREAFRRLGQKYHAARISVPIRTWLPETRQVHYTPDGILYARLYSAAAPLQFFHVEIKSGPFVIEESERCRALCRVMNQYVLLVWGGRVRQVDLDEASGASAVRPRPCVEMSLYVPQGPEAEPLFHSSVIWRFPEGGPAFLSFIDSADPQRREAARLKLLHIFHQATIEATRLSHEAGRTGPY